MLADALVAASDEQPDAIVDVATLTGAQVVALGHRIAGLMGDDELVAKVRAAADARRRGDLADAAARQPAAALKSDVADLANTKLGMTVPRHAARRRVPPAVRGTRDGSDDARSPGLTSTSPGRRNNSGARLGIHGTGATGVAVRTLVRLGEQLAAG